MDYPEIHIVGDPDYKDIPDVVAKIAEHLDGHGATIHQIHKRPDQASLDLIHADHLIIVVGGDGAILGAASSLDGKPTHILGVNLGKLGFMAAVERQNGPSSLTEIVVNGNYELSQRMMLKTVVTDDTGRVIVHGLNEAVIRSAEPKTVAVSLNVSGDHATIYRGDGVIIATPTGSTAYALAAGGPIIQPKMPAFSVTPICGHSINDRPVVIPGDSVVTMQVIDAPENTSISVDGKNITKVHNGSTIMVSQSDRFLNLIVPKHWNYFEILKSKMMWSGSSIKSEI